VLLRDTISGVLRNPLLPQALAPEVERELAATVALQPGRATVLTGVRRAGKSTLQAQLVRRLGGSPLYCNFEDTRLYGFGPPDFTNFLALADEIATEQAVFLDEVQEVDEWQRLVRALLDRGRIVCATGSNASLVGRELGAKLTGRHSSYEVFPFSYHEFCAYTGSAAGPVSFQTYLDAGGFPGFLRERRDQILQELLRDVVHRDVAARHGVRDIRHVMNLVLFLLANAGQPFSFQRLTKALAVPTVAQTSRYVSFLEDAYLIFAVPRFSASFRQRVVAPAKYYPVDTALARANSPQPQPDLGRRLESAVAQHLRRRAARGSRGRPEVAYADERDRWECDFVTAGEAIQACYALTPANVARELGGAVAGARLPGRRTPRIVTFDQTDRLREASLDVEVVPAWQWMSRTE
jgi:hypothetical protein